jgi:hypothetical protein
MQTHALVCRRNFSTRLASWVLTRSARSASRSVLARCVCVCVFCFWQVCAAGAAGCWHFISELVRSPSTLLPFTQSAFGAQKKDLARIVNPWAIVRLKNMFLARYVTAEQTGLEIGGQSAHCFTAGGFGANDADPMLAMELRVPDPFHRGGGARPTVNCTLASVFKSLCSPDQHTVRILRLPGDATPIDIYMPRADAKFSTLERAHPLTSGRCVCACGGRGAGAIGLLVYRDAVTSVCISPETRTQMLWCRRSRPQRAPPLPSTRLPPPPP